MYLTRQHTQVIPDLVSVYSADAIADASGHDVTLDTLPILASQLNQANREPLVGCQLGHM